MPQTSNQANIAKPQLTLLCAALALCVPLVHGYHPYAEDGGIYLAGIKSCLHPELYPRWTGFVSAHVQFSPFAHAVALFARSYPPALMGILFALYLLTTFATLFAASRIAQQLTHTIAAQRWAVALLAACLTLPVAGTSLMLMDPYVTARSLALPCILAAFAAALRPPDTRKNIVIVLSLAAAIVLHPLSGGYGAAVVAMLIALRQTTLHRRCAGLLLITLAAIAACLALRFAWSSTPPGYTAIAQSRTYWALSNWAWYELLGLAAPLLLLAVVARSRTLTAAGRTFATAMIAAGTLGIAVSVLFVHADGPSFAVARVQPLRIFLYVYLALPLCLAAWLAPRIRHTAARITLSLAVAAAMFTAQRNIYPSTNHIEWPWSQPANPYEQAFLWVRDNTPRNAAVAIDANYINARGEDAQNIRALTERSTPADLSKDGGIAAIRPALTPQWYSGVALQRDLAALSDNERQQRLTPYSIEWLVLPATAHTDFICPYRNRAAAVCHVTPPFLRPAN